MLFKIVIGSSGVNQEFYVVAGNPIDALILAKEQANKIFAGIIVVLKSMEFISDDVLIEGRD